jgi:hypothetical protein
MADRAIFQFLGHLSPRIAKAGGLWKSANSGLWASARGSFTLLHRNVVQGKAPV